MPIILRRIGGLSTKLTVARSPGGPKSSAAFVAVLVRLLSSTIKPPAAVMSGGSAKFRLFAAWRRSVSTWPNCAGFRTALFSESTVRDVPSEVRLILMAPRTVTFVARRELR